MAHDDLVCPPPVPPPSSLPTAGQMAAPKASARKSALSVDAQVVTTENEANDVARRRQRARRARVRSSGMSSPDCPPKRAYFKGAKPDEVVAVLKAREPARIMIAIGDRAANSWHLQFAERWVVQFNFYLNDERWGRMFVRMCPYLPFSARVCLNQHHWLANRMREESIDFRQRANAFMACAEPRRLQELADELTPRDLVSCG